MASDSFTNDDDTALATHDSNWGDLGGWNVSDLEINTNQVQGATDFTWCGARYTTSTEDVCQIVFKTGTTIATYQRVHVRATGSHTGYSAAFGGGSGGNWTDLTFYKNDSFLAGTGGYTISQASDHTMKITAADNGGNVDLELFIDTVSELTTSDTSAVYTSGSPGFLIRRENAASAADTRMDDFDDLASGGVTIGPYNAVGSGGVIGYGSNILGSGGTVG